MIEFFECLKSIQMVMMKAAAPKVQEFKFSNSELFIMIQIHFKKSARMTKLAKTLGIPASSATSIIDRLEKRGLVFREYDPNDRRSVTVRGTPELENTVQKVFGIYDEAFAEVLKPVPEELIKQAEECLCKLYGYISAENTADHAHCHGYNAALK